MTKCDEAVLCVPAPHVRSVLENPYTDDDKLVALLNFSTHIRRGETDGTDDGCEVDPNWKQLIPYIVCVNKDSQILAYNRGSKGGEKRLESKWAIGFGGHINNQDADWMAGIKREIREEIDVNHPIAFDERFYDKPTWAKLYGPIGFLNDDSDDVGRHHLGVVYVLRADEVVPRENPDWLWVTLEQMDRKIANDEMRVENWARLALPMVREWMESEGK